jgi:hypothetical protein
VAPPKEIAPLFALVLMMIDAAAITEGTMFVTMKELAVMLFPILTFPAPAPAEADEITRAPSLVVDPIAPVKVMVPPVPAFKVRS